MLEFLQQIAINVSKSIAWLEIDSETKPISIAPTAKLKALLIVFVWRMSIWPNENNKNNNQFVYIWICDDMIVIDARYTLLATHDSRKRRKPLKKPMRFHQYLHPKWMCKYKQLILAFQCAFLPLHFSLLAFQFAFSSHSSSALFGVHCWFCIRYSFHWSTSFAHLYWYEKCFYDEFYIPVASRMLDTIHLKKKIIQI